jgi:hypothetical protein
VSPDGRWLLLIHQIPPKPAYLRVKIARRLVRTGAVAIKNTVYVLPKSEQAQGDFQWILREVVQGGGEAAICEARFVEGMRDRDLEDLFNRARNSEYQSIAREARRKGGRSRLRKRLADVAALDYFGAPGRSAAELALAQRVKAGDRVDGRIRREDFRRRTWVTREGVGIDRMASAWLIRRFIDAAARFKFVPAHGYRPRPREVRFDMSEAEFTHEGERCTFEVLVERMGLDDPGLRPLAEMIHDIDLKDSRYEREETRGLEALVTAIRAAHASDERRLSRAFPMFDDLYGHYQKGRKP